MFAHESGLQYVEERRRSIFTAALFMFVPVCFRHRCSLSHCGLSPYPMGLQWHKLLARVSLVTLPRVFLGHASLVRSCCMWRGVGVSPGLDGQEPEYLGPCWPIVTSIRFAVVAGGHGH